MKKVYRSHCRLPSSSANISQPNNNHCQIISTFPLHTQSNYRLSCRSHCFMYRLPTISPNYFPCFFSYIFGFQPLKYSIAAQKYKILFARQIVFTDLWIRTDTVINATELGLFGFDIPECTRNWELPWKNTKWTDNKLILLLSRFCLFAGVAIS